MKLKHIFTLVALAGVLGASAQKKSGIIAFNFEGKDRQSSSMSGMGGVSNMSATDLYFIGENSVKLDSALTTDEIVRYTEGALKEWLGYELVPANLKRPAAAPEQMNGSYVVMETTTEKNAFAKLGYDEVIVVNARLYSAGKSGKAYKPAIEISVKVIGKDGKTVKKKSEKLKIENEKVDAKLIEYTDKNASVGDVFSFSKGGKNAPEGGEAMQGVPSTTIFDWYKQCFSNLILEK
jgi:hypothetical protein